MTKPKKQHYVPQFLLRKFCSPMGKSGQIWVLDKRDSKIFQASPKDVAHENSFYEYHSGEVNIELEDLMQKIDSLGAEIISKIIESGKMAYGQRDRVRLSHFVAAQIVRTPMMRNEMENLRQLLVHKWGKDLRVHPDDPKTVGEYTSEEARLPALQMMDDVPKFAKLLQDKVWCLCKSPGETAYLISDNPVTRHNMLNRWPRGNLGLRNDGLEIYMPISPHYSLYLICPKLASAALITPELESFVEGMLNGRAVHSTQSNVEFANSLQVIWAERFIVAQKREHLEIAIDMLQTTSELRDGPGVRQKTKDA